MNASDLTNTASFFITLILKLHGVKSYETNQTLSQVDLTGVELLLLLKRLEVLPWRSLRVPCPPLTQRLALHLD